MRKEREDEINKLLEEEQEKKRKAKAKQPLSVFREGAGKYINTKAGSSTSTEVAVIPEKKRKVAPSSLGNFSQW